MASKQKHELDIEDYEADLYWDYVANDPPPCRYCKGEYGEHKFGCDLIAAIAKANAEEQK